MVAETFLTEGLWVSRGQACRGVRAAVAVAAGSGTMPTLAAAFAAGEITREHVDVAVSAVSKLPVAVKRLVSGDGTTGLRVLDELVTVQAKAGPPGTVDQLGKDLLVVMDPDRACRLEEDAVTRRGGSHTVGYLGMRLFRFVLDPATGALVMPVFAAHAKPVPAGPGEGEDGQEVLFPDRRTHSQRLAGAFVAMARDAVAGGGLVSSDEPVFGAEPPDADDGADVDAESVDASDAGAGLGAGAGAGSAKGRCSGCGCGGDWPGSSLDPTTLGRLSCDAVLRRVLVAPNGAVVHHVIPWSEGGLSDTESMCLLCPRHHAAVHAQIWQLRMNDGIPWVRPPSWGDVGRRWFRDTTHEHRARARRAAQNLARQLRLPLDPPPG